MGRIVRSELMHVGHFSVQARQLTSQAKREGTMQRLTPQGAEALCFRALCCARIEEAELKMHYSTWQDAKYEDLYRKAYLLIKENHRTWPALGAAAGIPTGLCCPLAGTLLSMIAWSIKLQSLSSVLNMLGIAAFVFTLPLLALGAHCLDLLEKRPHESPLRTSLHRHPNLIMTNMMKQTE